jgi:hypothetical protein
MSSGSIKTLTLLTLLGTLEAGAADGQAPATRGHGGASPIPAPGAWLDTVSYRLEKSPRGLLLVPEGVGTVRNPPARK